MYQSSPRRSGALAMIAALLGTLTAVVTAGPASADIVKPIVFPVDGPVYYTDTFGAPRSGHTHEGQDLMAAKMVPALAAVDGTVTRITFNNATGNSLVITGIDGWTYHYIHVNNDTPGTDDGLATRAQAFPTNIQLGVTVKRGQLVAYVGDSGNAETTAPHIHFEIRQPAAPGTYTGVPINAYESLRQATIWSTRGRWELRTTATPGPAQEQFIYGNAVGDKGLLCDWDADGVDEPVIYRAGQWYLRSGNVVGSTTRSITFGTAQDTPLCGDVDGDGYDEPILFDRGIWTVRSSFEDAAPMAWTMAYGRLPGDRPVIGDWDGDGADDLAIFRAGGGWYLRSNGQAAGTTVATFIYGMQPGDQPIAGDWDGNGTTDPGIYRGTRFHLKGSLTAGTASTIDLGTSGGQPLVGVWSDTVRPGIGTFRPRTA